MHTFLSVILVSAFLVTPFASAKEPQSRCASYSSFEEPMYAEPFGDVVVYDVGFREGTELFSSTQKRLGYAHVMRPFRIRNLQAMQYIYTGDYEECRGMQVYVYASHLSNIYSFFTEKDDPAFRRKLRLFLARVRREVPKHFSDEKVCAHIRNAEMEDIEGRYATICNEM